MSPTGPGGLSDPEVSLSFGLGSPTFFDNSERIYGEARVPRPAPAARAPPSRIFRLLRSRDSDRRVRPADHGAGRAPAVCSCGLPMR